MQALVCCATLDVVEAVLIAICTGELGKILGGKWKEMDDDEKKVCFSLLV